jgi:RNA polymerase sigma factor (sigma-70 family)
MDDTDQLREFAVSGSEEAFQAIVDRHINIVYSAARQTTRDCGLAEEVTQTVFIILARKARKLGHIRALSGWLYRTSRLAAMQAVRNEARRRQREEKFGEMEPTTGESVWDLVEPYLAEVMDQLSEKDRMALVLRFFDSKSLKDVARALGTGEDAARMRVTRAVERLRGLFLKRGISVSAGALSIALAANSVQAAPAGLAASVAGTALAPTSACTTVTLVNATLKLMAWTKLRTGIATVAALLLLGGTTGVFTYRVVVLHTEQDAVRQAAEALVTALSHGDAQAFAEGLFTPDETERRLAASLGVLAKAYGAASAALLSRFGDTDDVWRIRYTFSMMSGIPLVGYLGQRTEIKVAGNEALFRCPALWPSIPLRFVRDGSKWKLAIDVGPRRGRWLDEAVARPELSARAYEQWAQEIRDGRYQTPEAAWKASPAWGNDLSQLPTPAVPRPKQMGTSTSPR